MLLSIHDQDRISLAVERGDTQMVFNIIEILLQEKEAQVRKKIIQEIDSYKVTNTRV